MKNYYEILEVDRNASQEVIEKAYKVLAKKYHPDLQQGSNKQQCAEKMKEINDAYDVLTDNLKREEYNQKLKNEDSIIKHTYEEIIYKHDFKYYLKIACILAMTILICFLIYQIPLVKQYFQNLYNENIIFQSIVDVLRNTLLTEF